jgi:hypothetical protein
MSTFYSRNPLCSKRKNKGEKYKNKKKRERRKTIREREDNLRTDRKITNKTIGRGCKSEVLALFYETCPATHK